MAVLQSDIPYDTTAKALPGIGPLDPEGWIICDEAFAGQMAQRDRLLTGRPDLVFADTGLVGDAKAELLSEVLKIVRTRDGYNVGAQDVMRPDGVRVPLNGDPLNTAARLIQEDLLIHDKRGEEHHLMAGVLCFPASWTLAEKIGHPLTRVHRPVDDYDANIAKRVQRLFDGIKVGRPMWRFNNLRYPTPELFQPRSERAPRAADHDYQSGNFQRSEHQALLRLPETGAVVFAIHTYVVRVAG